MTRAQLSLVRVTSQFLLPLDRRRRRHWRVVEEEVGRPLEPIRVLSRETP